MRASGVLLPIASLPSAHGVGSLGRDAYRFVDFLVAAGQSYWQILPIGPTGYGDSPYQSFSAMAGSPYYIDLDLLAENGLLEHGEIGTNWGKSHARVDYGLLFKKRFAVLGLAAQRQDKTAPDYLDFCETHAGWLQDYALFMAIKEANGQVGFTEWPRPLRMREAEALEDAKASLAPRVEFWRCVQFFFYTQWAALKEYANQHGVAFIGDIPIYVSSDSSEVWAEAQLFETDEEGNLSLVAGVPPDGFSEDGQLWGNPLYDWSYHKSTGYAWWIERLRISDTLFDMIRIDHFRGFAGYYAIPFGAKTAQNGCWHPGPGEDFIHTIHRELPNMRIIAEDLGFLDEEVFSLLRASGYPGMRVLQFAFGSCDENVYLPHNYPRHTAVYTGTHDNATTEEWWRTAPEGEVQNARRYLGLARGQNLTEALVRAALASVADTAVIPIQDWLRLGAHARINTPATLGGANWRWRLLPGQLTPALAEHMREHTRLYSRLQPDM